MRACRPKTWGGETASECKRQRTSVHAQERERCLALWLLFLYVFFLPLGLPYVNRASQEGCLFPGVLTPVFRPSSVLFSSSLETRKKAGRSLPCIRHSSLWTLWALSHPESADSLFSCPIFWVGMPSCLEDEACKEAITHTPIFLRFRIGTESSILPPSARAPSVEICPLNSYTTSLNKHMKQHRKEFNSTSSL